MIRYTLRQALAAGLLVLAVASCGGSGTQSNEGTATTDNAATPAPTMSDANIAAIVVAANNADIENGKQAQTKGHSAEVKAFAQQMVTDHTAVNGKATELAGRLGLTPQDDATSMAITSGQDSVRASLGSMSGTAFDKAYVDNEVTYHQTVLDAIDNALIPNAQNAELKQLLTDTRPAIAAHLEHAKMLQSKLGSAAQK